MQPPMIRVFGPLQEALVPTRNQTAGESLGVRANCAEGFQHTGPGGRLAERDKVSGIHKGVTLAFHVA